VPLDPLMTYAINGLKNSNKEVREAALKLIMNIYRFIGDNVRNYYKDLRQPQINMLEEGFEKVDGLGGNVEQDDDNNNNHYNKGVNNQYNDDNDDQMDYDNNKNNKKNMIDKNKKKIGNNNNNNVIEEKQKESKII
jgi:hypothetical protein